MLLVIGACLLTFSISLALVSLAWPYCQDHAIMTVVGRAWRLGVAPYTTFIDVKGPVAYLPFLLADWLGNGSMAGIRVLDLLVVTSTVAILYRSMRTVIGGRAAGWGALLLFGMCYRVGYTESAQPDEWAALSCAAVFALLLQYRARIPLWLFVVSGVVTALAALVKPQFAALGGFPILVAVLGNTEASRVRSIVTLIVASLTPVAIACGVLLAQGALDDMLAVATGPLMRAYLAERAIIPRTMEQLRAAVQFPLLMSYGPPLFLLGAIGVYEATRLERRVAIALLAWLGGATFLVVIQGRYFAYHWFPMLPPLCLLAGLALARTLPRWAQAPVHARRTPVLAAGIVALLALTLSFGGRAFRNVMAVSGEMRQGHSFADAVRRSVDPAGSSPRFRSNVAVAEYVTAHAGSDRTVGAWLFDPSPLLFAHVWPNARQFFVHPSMARQSAIADSILKALATELHHEAPPLFILDCNTAWLPGSAAPERSPWLVDELTTNYEPTFASGALIVYRHRTAPRPAATFGTTSPDSTLCGPQRDLSMAPSHGGA